MSIGNFPESLSQAILVGIMLVGRFGRNLNMPFGSSGAPGGSACFPGSTRCNRLKSIKIHQNPSKSIKHTPKSINIYQNLPKSIELSKAGRISVCPGAGDFGGDNLHIYIYIYICERERVVIIVIVYCITSYYVCMYVYTYIYIYIEREREMFFMTSIMCCYVSYISCHTVSFHNFKSQNLKLSVSNPKSRYVAYVSVLSRISNCQGLGRKSKLEIMKTDLTANGYHCYY